MPTGFLLMIAGAIMADRVVVPTIVKSAFQMPALLFFIVTVIGITGMILCARKFDRCDIRGNWIEQTINAIAQASFMAGIILALK